MSKLDDLLNPKTFRSKTLSPKVRTFIVIAEIIFVTVLFVIWFGSASLRQNRHLWVLFLYSIPGNFLIDIIPYDPVVILFGSLHDPFLVSLVGVAGILVSETINYTCFEYVVDFRFFNRILNNPFVVRLISLFNRAPFWVMLIVAFTPVPIYPFRFLVVMARFPLFKYLLALWIGRLPRLYLIALFGHVFNLPWYAYLLIFIGSTILMYFPLLRLIPGRQKKEPALDS